MAHTLSAGHGAIMSAIEIVPLIASFLLGIGVLYFTAYSKVKSKNRALQEAVSKLESEKKNVVSKQIPAKEQKELHSSQLRRKRLDSVSAEIKILPSLDIEQRECLYDEKSLLCLKYFTLLDEFHRKSNAIFTLQFHPVLNRFLALNSVDDETARERALLEFNSEVQVLYNQLYDGQRTVNSETEAIRSISSATLGKLLDKLVSAVKQSTDDASEVLKFMATPALWADQTLALSLQKVENSVQMFITCRNAVRSRMHVELNEL